MTEQNRDQIEYWNGEVGQRWAARHAALDAVFKPLTDALFKRAALNPGERVLDIGCGAGKTALRAARTVTESGRVLAADLSAPLLAVARQRAAREPASTAPIEWIEADAQSHDFGQGAFHHALSRFGVMFFDDTEAAFDNIGRALGSGGRLTFLCWRALEENAWVRVPREVVLPLVPGCEPMAPDAPGPFRFADPRAVLPILDAAGYRDISCDPIDRTLTIGHSVDGSAKEAVDAATDIVVDLGPVARLLRDRDADLRESARATVAETLEHHVRDGAVRLGAACWLISATRR
ncbi:class I SAM-dependent methyltransferase [Methylobacterium brachythecii]|uniref:Methyltransferase n=1 Tax=Methylobacterium brachythecii TaxID=1176177 RepID=A0A7W6AF76_9HYPH|nr:class I SAM-dependent methyltransferase [Methylobacterium brachythecii]MBB3902198.1 SAM-dependent methyltransferase [Methylobacterium brachythecii]GLS42043.1 methyltransferase [Methylobacterium brachythecii]